MTTTRHQQQLWKDMLRQSWNPRQWFTEDRPQDHQAEDRIMWVYRIVSETRFEVGYWTPDKVWQLDSVYESREKAGEKVHYLNGGPAT